MLELLLCFINGSQIFDFWHLIAMSLEYLLPCMNLNMTFSSALKHDMDILLLCIHLIPRPSFEWSSQVKKQARHVWTAGQLW